MKIEPKLTVIGAGPGDPDLITFKAVNVLKEADVVLYDALIDKELLKHADGNAIRIHVGKRKGRHSITQDEINRLIVQYAYTHGHVVRLKGGDPFVFGRGMEEIEYASLFGLKTTYIPGISSSVSVPGAVGIPLTHRGVSEGFWVITGTKSDRRLANDLKLAAHSNSTIVILMGLSKLNQIEKVFSGVSSDDIPAAIIQNGCTSNQHVILGTAGKLSQLKSKLISDAPGIIVVGKVVCLSELYKLTQLELNQVN